MTYYALINECLTKACVVVFCAINLFGLPYASLTIQDDIAISEELIWKNAKGSLVHRYIRLANQEMAVVGTILDSDGKMTLRLLKIRNDQEIRNTQSKYNGMWCRRFKRNELSFFEFPKGGRPGLIDTTDSGFGRFEFFQDGIHPQQIYQFLDGASDVGILPLATSEQLSLRFTKDRVFSFANVEGRLNAQTGIVSDYHRNGRLIMKRFQSRDDQQKIEQQFVFLTPDGDECALFFSFRDKSKLLFVESASTKVALLDLESDGTYDLLEMSFDRAHENTELFEILTNDIKPITEALIDELGKSTNESILEIVRNRTNGR